MKNRYCAGNANRNAARSVALLNDALAALLNELPFPQITVTMLTRRADLARNTFYAHFSSSDNLLEEFVGAVLERTRATMLEAADDMNPRHPGSFLRRLIEAVDRDRTLLLTHVFVDDQQNRACLSSAVRGGLIPICVDILDARNPGHRGELALYAEFLVDLTMDVVGHYLHGALSQTTQEMVTQLTQIYMAAFALYLMPHGWVRKR
ncbi:TetR/AcrR family transcriptional regulator [Pseudoscardovia radai]|uniref:TetR/AcrR family transcriptional regulator n=1 Tax=Pseudoscardovia radai TaxID=987066 RepID=UPI003995211E